MFLSLLPDQVRRKPAFLEILLIEPARQSLTVPVVGIQGLHRSLGVLVHGRDVPGHVHHGLVIPEDPEQNDYRYGPIGSQLLAEHLRCFHMPGQGKSDITDKDPREHEEEQR